MREFKYLKKKSRQMVTGAFEEFESSKRGFGSKLRTKKALVAFSCLFVFVFLSAVLVAYANFKQISVTDSATIQPMVASMTMTNTKRTVIEIPSGTVKANPFLPYRDTGVSISEDGVSKYDLIEPPEVSNQNSEAARVMRTVVSGILYDRYSPSAILNIEGSDYLVKKGDVVNNYNVLNIAKDTVTVKLGSNVYKAGIGELLTEGSIHHNNVSNLNNKFGGENNGVQ